MYTYFHHKNTKQKKRIIGLLNAFKGTPVLLQELLSGIIPNEKPFDALIQGAPIRLDTPLAWIDKALCNFDMINYIVIRLK